MDNPTPISRRTLAAPLQSLIAAIQSALDESKVREVAQPENGKQSDNRKMENMESTPSPLAAAVELAHVGIKWEPQHKRLTLLQPPLDALFTDYKLAWNKKGTAIGARSEWDDTQKRNARHALMEQLHAVVRDTHPEVANVALLGHVGVVVKNPSPALLESLSLSPDTAFRSTMPARDMQA